MIWLLNTHALLWESLEPNQLGRKTRAIAQLLTHEQRQRKQVLAQSAI